MAIDPAKVGNVAAQLMEGLEQKFESDESAQITTVFLITATDHSDGQRTSIDWSVSEGIPTHEGRDARTGQAHSAQHQHVAFC
jgi:hypothetical protein